MLDERDQLSQDIAEQQKVLDQKKQQMEDKQRQIAMYLASA